MSRVSLVSHKSSASETRPASVAHTMQGYLALTKPRITVLHPDEHGHRIHVRSASCRALGPIGICG